jgi:hypothetical protein
MVWQRAREGSSGVGLYHLCPFSKLHPGSTFFTYPAVDRTGCAEISTGPSMSGESLPLSVYSSANHAGSAPEHNNHGAETELWTIISSLKLSSLLLDLAPKMTEAVLRWDAQETGQNNMRIGRGCGGYARRIISLQTGLRRVVPLDALSLLELRFFSRSKVVGKEDSRIYKLGQSIR